MSKINAYLGFENNGQEAMTFYQGCFGGELTISKVGESPMAAEMPPETHGLIMHAQLTSGDLAIMATEMGGCSPEPLVKGNNISLAVACESQEEIEKYFAYLSEGGSVMCPLGPSFWGTAFGAVTDKYGIAWLLNYESGGEQ